MGFGLTVEVVMDPIAARRRTRAAASAGTARSARTSGSIAKEQLAGILLIQQAVNAALNRDFENAVMQAIVE